MAKGNDGERWHFVYRTTNKVNGKYYIGVHSTWKLDDGYLGSGKRLGYSIKKHGRENFECEIIQFFESHEEALLKERELVNEQLLRDPMCMNLRIGGEGGGGFTEVLRKRGVQSSLKRRNWLRMNDSSWRLAERERLTSIAKDQMKNPSKRSKFVQAGRWTGRKHRADSIEKIRKSSVAKKIGSNNPQFGRIWMHNEVTRESRRFPPDQEHQMNLVGWKRGRKMYK